MLKEYPFEFYGCKKIRVIADSDCACEGDDAFAIAHMLITSKFDMVAVTASNFAHIKNSIQKSYDALKKLVDVMELLDQIPILRGSNAMKSETEYERSEASEFIVEEAMKDDQRPLFVVVQGAITNLAVALKTRPEIAKRIQCIWIGGASYPKGGWEFNLMGDVIAARTIMESDIPLWQVPQNVYSMMRISFMTIYERLYSSGNAGKYLCKQLWEAHQRMAELVKQFGESENFSESVQGELYTNFASGEVWVLGDSPVVGLMMDSQQADREIIGAPHINDDGTYVLREDNPRKIVVYKSIDAQFIFNDFFDKMKYQFGENM